MCPPPPPVLRKTCQIIRNHNILKVRHLLAGKYEEIFIRHHIVRWEPEGPYHYSTMFCWEPEGCYHCTRSMVIAPFCFPTKHHWTTLLPLWFSADIINKFLLHQQQQNLIEIHVSYKCSLDFLCYPLNSWRAYSHIDSEKSNYIFC